MQAKFIKHICKCTADDYRYMGNKAINLHKLFKQGFDIPETWILSPSILISLLEREGLYQNGLKVEDFPMIEEEIEFRLNDELTVDLWNEFQYDTEAFWKKAVVIRSSSPLEDSETLSFAGMFHTDINVKKTMNIIHSILKIWKKNFSFDIQELCRSYNIQIIEPCSIIIQELINTKVGGVSVRDDSHIYINSCYGLTKSIVDGTTNPDQWVFARGSYSLSNHNKGSKDKAIFPIHTKTNPDLNQQYPIRIHNQDYETLISNISGGFRGTLVEVSLPNDIRESVSLEQSELDYVLERCEQAGNQLSFYNYDIEWAIDQSGKLWFLQIRYATSNIGNLCAGFSDALPLVQGIAVGKVQFVRNERESKDFTNGNILVAKRISGTIIHASTKAIGCIVESESVLSHSAIIARELNLPCIGVKSIDDIDNGGYYEINGKNGEYKKILSGVTAVASQTDNDVMDISIDEDFIEGICGKFLFIPVVWTEEQISDK